MKNDKQQEGSCPNSWDTSVYLHKSPGKVSAEKKRTGNKYIRMFIMVVPVELESWVIFFSAFGNLSDYFTRYINSF